MMIIFGFTVRWLGARSGNFIEDSGGIDSGGYHFENKFRRKTRIKRKHKAKKFKKYDKIIKW